MKIVALPLAALAFMLVVAHSAGAADTEGGSTEAKAQPGCMNQWLFNGMWRVRVTKVAFHAKDDQRPNGWDVTMQWRNGTPIAGLYPTQTNMQDMVLAFKNGDTLSAAATTTGSLIQQKLTFHEFPPSGQFTFTQEFRSADPLDEANPPAKLLVTFDVATYKKNTGSTGKFWTMKTPAYNYRVDLTCDKAVAAN
jgi:hypothetical protein